MGKTVLLTGATGYVGGRLLRVLEDRGIPVRCFARSPLNLCSRVGPGTEVVGGDAVSGEGLAEALTGVETAYYLIHSMGSSEGFEEQDRRAATRFGAAARAAGVARIVYLGGIADESQSLSPHLRSRVEVGHRLRESGVPVIELRASIVIGSGSLSFEMIRSIVDHLPILVTPRWVSTPAQPIGVDDLLDYLVASLTADPSGNPIFEIGGSDRMSYADLMREYAHQRGLRRWLLPVPVLSPRLSSLWLGLVTPLHARVGRKLIDSIRHETVVRNDAAKRAFSIRPRDVRTAVARALQNEDHPFAQTRWNDSGSATRAAMPIGSHPAGRALEDSRQIDLAVPAACAFGAVRRIGGRTGWYAHDWLWQLRGILDLVLGGVGMRRGRRDPESLEVGDTIDCWRVEAIEPGRRLRLRAEMSLPGSAWLEFEVAPVAGGCRLRQTAFFEPRGIPGHLYWYGIHPLHGLVFGGMLRGIAKAAREEHRHERAKARTAGSTRHCLRT